MIKVWYYHGDSKSNPPLLFACYFYRYDVMRFLLSNGEIVINADIITFSDSDGNTALHLVICKNKNGGSTFLHSVVMHDIDYDSTVQSNN